MKGLQSPPSQEARGASASTISDMSQWGTLVVKGFDSQLKQLKECFKLTSPCVF